MQNGSIRGPREDSLPNAITDDSIKSALHEASANGDEQTLLVLLVSGADRNAKDHKHGNTPLHEAAWRGFSRCVKALCALPQTKVVKDVKETKLKGVLQDTRGALHSALLGTRNSGGFSALHLAAQNGHNQSCREILLAGADPDVQNNYGDTPLHTACRYGHAGATRILLSAKCDPNRTNLNGDASLHISCAMGRRKLTRILLEAGANIGIKNAQSETPRDIAVRKNLPEILEILDNPITPASPTKSRERSSNNSKNATAADKVDSGATAPGAHKSTGAKKKTDLGVAGAGNPTKWSPYGCHYFPDPRSFPSPKLETLPKEPLAKGEQYYLDLAGNIRKGPIGVGNTCYCGPFFRHIEEKITRNRKSLRKYVHKATERLDNKVEALALRTDDQIEQLQRSMMAERIRCDGRRLHLEQWLMRGDTTRATVSHHQKLKKNLDNTNTLSRCRSLELLDSNDLIESKLQNSKSFDMLDESGEDPNFSNRSENPPSILSSDRKPSKHSADQSRTSRSSNRHQDEDQYSVSKRLEELLTKTNEILEMEKKVRLKKKIENLAVLRRKPRTSEKVHKRRSLYSEDILENQLKSVNLSSEDPSKVFDESEYIKYEMERIATALDPDSNVRSMVPPMSPEISKECASQKELERRTDQEHEKSSIVSGSSHKDPSLTGSEYVSELNRLQTNGSRSNSADITQRSLASSNEQTASPSGRDQIDSDDKFKNLISALRRDYHSTKKAIEAELARDSSQGQNSSTGHYDENTSEYSDEQPEIADPHGMMNGFYENSCFDDAISSSNNTLKSERHHRSIILADPDENPNLSEMAKIEEINELKSRILNGSNWRSQVLKKSLQQQKKSSADISPSANYEDTRPTSNININGVVKKLNIKNSEIKTLKSPSSGILRRTKVQELVAKIEGDGGQNQNNGDDNYQSESSEDETDPSLTSQQIKNHSQQHQYLSVRPDIHSRAQPQVASLSESNLAPAENPPIPGRVIDMRNLIPKDAYFHELPNRVRTTNLTNHIQNTHAVRVRDPLPYIQGFADIPSETIYANRPQQGIVFAPPVVPVPKIQPRFQPYQEKLLSSRKFTFSNAVDNELSRIQMNQLQQQQIQTPSPTLQAPSAHTILLTPEQALIERELNNDSGYSTKMCGSPSLSGHTDLENGGAPVSVNGYPPQETNGVTYFIGNVGASSLV